MVTNLNTKEIMQEMEKTVDKVLNNLKSWDGSLESGIKIVEYNEIHFDELKTFDLLLEGESITYDEEYLDKISEVLYEHKKLKLGLKIEQDRLVLLMQQLNKKEDVIKSYISIKKEPIFIDKDIK